MATRAIVLALVPALAGLSLLASACGGSSSSGVAAATRGDAMLSFSRCMRAHGVPAFPDPDAQGNFPSFRAGVSKQASAAASRVCKHLLPNGGTGTPQQRQQKFAFALKVARCLRGHGYPTFPDPAASGQQIPPTIDTQSSQFQSAETNCEKRAQKALGLP